MAGPSYPPGTFKPEQVGGSSVVKKKTKLSSSRVNFDKFKFSSEKLSKLNYVEYPNVTESTNDNNAAFFNELASSNGQSFRVDLFAHITSGGTIEKIMNAGPMGNNRQIYPFLSTAPNRLDYNNFFLPSFPKSTSIMGSGDPADQNLNEKLIALDGNNGKIDVLNWADGSIVETIVTPEEIAGNYLEVYHRDETNNIYIVKFSDYSGPTAKLVYIVMGVIDDPLSPGTNKFGVIRKFETDAGNNQWYYIKSNDAQKLGYFIEPNALYQIHDFINNVYISYPNTLNFDINNNPGFNGDALFFNDNATNTVVIKYLEGNQLVDEPTDKSKIVPNVAGSFGNQLRMYYTVTNDGNKNLWYVDRYGLTFFITSPAGKVLFEKYHEFSNNKYDTTYIQRGETLWFYSNNNSGGIFEHNTIIRSVIKNHNSNILESIISNHFLDYDDEYFNGASWKEIAGHSFGNNTLTPYGLVKELVDMHGATYNNSSENDTYVNYDPSKDIYYISTIKKLASIDFPNYEMEAVADGKEIILLLDSCVTIDFRSGNIKSLRGSAYWKPRVNEADNFGYSMMKLKFVADEGYWIETSGQSNTELVEDFNKLLTDKAKRTLEDSIENHEEATDKNLAYKTVGPKLFAAGYANVSGTLKVSSDEGATWTACTGPVDFDKLNGGDSLAISKKIAYDGTKYYMSNVNGLLFSSVDGITWVLDSALTTLVQTAVDALSAAGEFVTDVNHRFQFLVNPDTNKLNIIWCKHQGDFATYLLVYSAVGGTIENSYKKVFAGNTQAFSTFEMFWYNSSWKVYASLYDTTTYQYKYHSLDNAWNFGLPYINSWPRATITKKVVAVGATNIGRSDGTYISDVNQFSLNGNNYYGWPTMIPFARNYANKMLMHIKEDGTGIAWVNDYYTGNVLYKKPAEHSSYNSFILRTTDFGRTWIASNLESNTFPKLGMYILTTKYTDYGITPLPSGDYLFYDKNHYFKIKGTELPKPTVRKKVEMTTIAATNVDTPTGMAADSIVTITKKSDGSVYTPTTVVNTDGNIAITAAEVLDLVITIFGVEV